MTTSRKSYSLPPAQQGSAQQDISQEVTVWDTDGSGSFAVARFGRRVDSGLFHVMRLVAMFDSIWVPFLLSFGQLSSVEVWVRHKNVITLDAFLCSLYACGVVVQLRTSYVVLSTGQEHIHPLKIMMHRFSSATFWADMVSCLGTLWWFRNWQMLAILRMLRVWRLSPSADDLYELHYAELSSDSAAKNLVALLFFTGLVMHVFACTWFFTATLVQEWEEKMLLSVSSDFVGAQVVMELYAQHMKDGATMFAGWGGPLADSEDGHYTRYEIVAWCILAPCSALVNGVIFVELVEITRQIGASTEKHLQRLGELGAVLDSLHAPKPLKQRCMKYHCFLSIHNANRKEYESMFDALSQRLQEEIKIHLFDTLVRSAPFFDAIPLDILHNLVVSCEEEVYGPGQTIMRQGDIGTDLFFVMKGIANVFVNDECVAVKEVGQYFGEIGLVYDAPRTASVCAKSFTIVARLTRSAFVQVLQQGSQDVKEEVTRRIMEKVGAITLTPEAEKETTPLLTAERFPTNCRNHSKEKNNRGSLAESLVDALGENGTDSRMEARMQNLEHRLDRLSVMLEDKLSKISTQIMQLGCARHVV